VALRGGGGCGVVVLRSEFGKIKWPTIARLDTFSGPSPPLLVVHHHYFWARYLLSRGAAVRQPRLGVSFFSFVLSGFPDHPEILLEDRDKPRGTALAPILHSGRSFQDFFPALLFSCCLFGLMMSVPGFLEFFGRGRHFIWSMWASWSTTFGYFANLRPFLEHSSD